MHRLTRHGSGSALLLFPAGILVVVVLAAIAVDSSIAFLAQRSAYNHAHDAAALAANVAVDLDSVDTGGPVRLDPATAELVVRRGLATADDDLAVTAITVDGATLTVTVTYPVETIFAPALPGADRSRRRTVTVTVRGEVGDP